MGLLSHKVKKEKIKPGDHIYTYRALFTYSHHGIYVGGNKVVHFTPDNNWNISSSSSSSFNLPTGCLSFPECGIRRPNNGVTISCLDCFLGQGSPYLYNYGVFSVTLLAKRGGTCTTAQSDPPETVIHTAMLLLLFGFVNYDVYLNNCEDFALYCKTGLLDKKRSGSSGQASSIVDAPIVAVLFSSLRFLMSPVGVASVSTGMYFVTRYGSDIGVRSNGSLVNRVPVVHLNVNSGRSDKGEGDMNSELIGTIHDIISSLTSSNVAESVDLILQILQREI